MQSIEQQFNSLVSKAMAQIDEIGAEIATLEAQKQELKTAPLPESVALERLESVLDGAARKAGENRITQLVKLASTWTEPAKDNKLEVTETGEQRKPLAPILEYSGLDSEAALFLFSDLIKQSLMSELSNYYKTLEPGLPHIQRLSKIRELDEEIAELTSRRDGMKSSIRGLG